MGPRSNDLGKRWRGWAIGIVGIRLQWGRDQMISESGSFFGLATPEAKLQWGRDQMISERPRVPHQYPPLNRFNGAEIK